MWWQNPDGALVPEFGAWDVTDPKSGEGYTAIFSEIRKEKQSATRHVPSKTPSLNNCSNIQNQCGRPSSILSKVMLLHIYTIQGLIFSHYTHAYQK